ncbi:hypothetical protein CsatA_001131 [Cannabis sativa]
MGPNCWTFLFPFLFFSEHKMSASGSKSSKKKGKGMATLEEFSLGPVAQEGYKSRATGWEAAELRSTLTCPHQLENIINVAGIKPSTSGTFHRPPRDSETPNHNYDGFGDWSQTHLMTGAMLPLQDYFVNFLVFVGLAPYQLIPQAYRLLSGLFIFYTARGWGSPSPAKILYFYELVSVPKKGDKLKDGFYGFRIHPANEGVVPYNRQTHVKEYRHRFFFSSGFRAVDHPELLTEWVRIPPYQRTLPTQAFLRRAQAFASYDHADLDVGGLVTTENCRKAKLILSHQSVDDSNLSRVICPNVRAPVAEKAFRDELIATAEKKYQDYLYRKAQEKAYSKAQAASGRGLRVGSPVERRSQAIAGKSEAKFFDKILQEEIGDRSARRPLRIEDSSEKQTSRPQPSAPEPNSGAPGASTSGAGDISMDAILEQLAGVHTPVAPPAFTSSPPAPSLKVSSSAPPDTIDLVDDEEVLPGEGQGKGWDFSEEAVEGAGEPQALPEVAEEDEEEPEVALIRKRKGKMVAQDEPKRPRRADTPAHGLDGGVSPMEENPAPPHIELTPIPGDEVRQELRIAKHNYAMDEYSRGHAEVEALRRILRAEVEASINHPEYQDPWDLNLDPLSDWFRRLLGPTLAPFAAEMTGEFASQLTRCAPKRFATCASLNSIFQVQDLSHSLTVVSTLQFLRFLLLFVFCFPLLRNFFLYFVMAQLAAEAGRLSKNIINHGFTLSDFGDMNDVRKVLQDLTAERQIYQEAAERQEAAAKAKEEEAKRREAQAEAMIRDEAQRRDRMEAQHQEELRAQTEAAEKARRDLREAREALDEMVAKVRSLEETHQSDIESKAALAAELKELRDFKEQSARKAKRAELLSPVSCARCPKRFDDDVYMAWATNDQSIKLTFYPKPEEMIARFREKKKKLDAALEARIGPRLPPRAD